MNDLIVGRESRIQAKVARMDVAAVRDKLLAAHEKYGDLQVLDAPPALVEALQDADTGPPVYVYSNSVRGHSDIFLGEPTHVPDYQWDTGESSEETRVPISERTFSVWGVRYGKDGNHSPLPGCYETNEAGLTEMRMTVRGDGVKIYWSDATDAQEALEEATEAFARHAD